MRERINKKLALFRNHDEQILREQLAHREDEKGMISYTNQANLELDQILQADGESIYEAEQTKEEKGLQAAVDDLVGRRPIPQHWVV